MKNRDLMSSGNPFKAVIVFSIPSIIAMVVNSVYNVADKIFIGNFVSSDALGGLQVVNSLTYFSFGIMVMFGLGSASFVSNKLGEQKDKEANKIFNNALFISSLSVLFLSTIIFIFRKGLLKLAGANDTTYDYAFKYYSVLIVGFIFQSLGYFFTMNIRSEGRPNYSMICQVTGCFVNIALDALFIIVFKWGEIGAGIATVIGQVSNALLGFYYYLISKKHYFRINIKEMFDVNWNYIFQTATIGISSLVLNICTGLSIIIFNNVLKKYESGLTILAILTSLDTICILPCVGIRQGLLPLFGYNYGEKNYKRMFSLWLVGILYGCTFGVLVCILLAVFPEFFINLFVDSELNEDLIASTVTICRFYHIAITIISLNMNAAAFYQGSRDKIKSSILSAMRQCIFLIPLLYIFDMKFGFTGVWYAVPISDASSAISAIILMAITYITYKKTGYLSLKDKRIDMREKNDC